MTIKQIREYADNLLWEGIQMGMDNTEKAFLRSVINLCKDLENDTQALVDKIVDDTLGSIAEHLCACANEMNKKAKEMKGD